MPQTEKSGVQASSDGRGLALAVTLAVLWASFVLPLKFRILPQTLPGYLFAPRWLHILGAASGFGLPLLAATAAALRLDKNTLWISLPLAVGSLFFGMLGLAAYGAGGYLLGLAGIVGEVLGHGLGAPDVALDKGQLPGASYWALHSLLWPAAVVSTYLVSQDAAARLKRHRFLTCALVFLAVATLLTFGHVCTTPVRSVF